MFAPGRNRAPSHGYQDQERNVLARATPERLSAFSDGVFAVLITVLVLELHPPEEPTLTALLALWHRWLSYGVSYLFIAIVWVHHHHFMRVADETTRLLETLIARLEQLQVDIHEACRAPIGVKEGARATPDASRSWR
jgi:Endosomal/lysosomal potassium channel TMEM175